MHKIKLFFLTPSSVNQPHPSFLGPFLDACWEPRPAPLSTESQVHSGSALLALYQHELQRCKPGLCVAACVHLLIMGVNYIFWALDWVRADYEFVHPDLCGYGCIFKLAWGCRCRGIRSQASPMGLSGPDTSKGHGGPVCQPARQGENPVYMAKASFGRTSG